MTQKRENLQSEVNLLNARILVGDIGGTTTRLAMAAGVDFEPSIKRYESRHFATLADVVRAFLQSEQQPVIACACFAVAGPVTHHGSATTAALTNLDWRLDSRTLATDFGIPRVCLINDFEAVGYALSALTPHDFTVLQAGIAAPGAPRGAIGAGTGLGQAIVVARDGGDVVIPTEGGHVDFAATNALQWEFVQWWTRQHARISYEDVLSGEGLARIHAFFCQRNARHSSQSDDVPAAVISQRALIDRDPLAGAALDLFVEIYGRQAGNFALAAGATGGVYIAGGIALHLLEKLQEGTFLRAFIDKGPMSALLQRVPLAVITRRESGLLGAYTYARQTSLTAG